MGYFGLDQVGAELECPFGTQENDLPLLQMGVDLSRNLDTLMRNACRAVKRSNQLKMMQANIDAARETRTSADSHAEISMESRSSAEASVFGPAMSA